MTYLERYRNGEYEQVWNELVALGARVREPELIADATAVARETMTRVAANVATLAQRLEELNYIYFWPDGGHCPPSPEIDRHLAKVEAEIGVLPISLHTWYETVGSVDFTGRFPPLYMQALLNELDPRNLLIGKMGKAAGLLGDRELVYIYSDALVVFPLEVLQENWQPGEHLRDVAPDEEGVVNGIPWWELGNASVAPEFRHKAGFSGGEFYRMWIPYASIDGPVLNLPSCYTEQPPWDVNMWLVYPVPPVQFVEYLRLCFRWGGFPGFAVVYADPPILISELAKGLIPF